MIEDQNREENKKTYYIAVGLNDSHRASVAERHEQNEQTFRCSVISIRSKYKFLKPEVGIFRYSRRASQMSVSPCKTIVQRAALSRFVLVICNNLLSLFVGGCFSTHRVIDFQ